VQQQIHAHPTLPAAATPPVTHPSTSPSSTPAAHSTTSAPPAGMPSDAWNALPPSVQQQIQPHPYMPPQPPTVQLNTPPTTQYMTTHRPPDLDILPSEWRDMSPEERIAAWTPPKNPDLLTLPPNNQQQAHPPPGSGLSLHEWHDMTPEERAKEWNGTPHVEVPTLPSPAAQQAGRPPDSNVNIREWQEMTPAERTKAWSSYVASNTVFVANPKLRDFLSDPANKDIHTVQDLIELARDSKEPNGYNNTIEQAGLDPDMVQLFRTANLSDVAVVRPPPQGTLPGDIAQANVFHLVEYNTTKYGTPYNTSFPGTGKGSNNCGPASLAIALRIAGQMPAGLNAEQQIDYARHLIDNKDNGHVTVAGTDIPIYDNDKERLGYGSIAGAAPQANYPMTYTNGWAALDNSLANGHPAVAAGIITNAWTSQFPDRGTYGSFDSSEGPPGHFVAVVGKTPDGKYIVSDPMWTGGAVTMTRDELRHFFKDSYPLITTVGQ